jgi:hypothetical protein
MPKGLKPRPQKVTAQDIADSRGALDFAQDIARAHGDDCRLAFRKADRALDRIAMELFAKGPVSFPFIGGGRDGVRCRAND